jgi:hypothetical protein
MKLSALLKGAASYVPGVAKNFIKGTGGTVSARYCYSIWLRHLVMADQYRLTTRPSTVAELGPGDSIGTGLAALLSGSERYYALDVVRYADDRRNMEMFEALVELFNNREDIPGEDEFPNVKPFLQSYKFPSHILTEERLKSSLREDRIDEIRRGISSPGNSYETRDQSSKIYYCVPWYESDAIDPESVDMIYSQAVLEHVIDLQYTYEVLYNWLKKDGVMSHQIDFRCHKTAHQWNGHWAHSDFIWKVLWGKRKYGLNRQPCSYHLAMMDRCKFDVVCQLKVTNPNGIRRQQLASRFGHLSDEDLTTSGAFIISVKHA